MRALIKNSRKIVLNQVDPSERALIDEFVAKSLKQVTTIRSLYDIDNELDGMSLELTGNKQKQINFRTPCVQVLKSDSTIKVDLKVDDETIIEIDEEENEDYLDVVIEDRLIKITALNVPELVDTTGQYIVTVLLEKDGYETTIVPINVSVLYFDGSSSGTRNYEELRNQPSINDKVLIGDRTSEELGLQDSMDVITIEEIDEIL